MMLIVVVACRGGLNRPRNGTKTENCRRGREVPGASPAAVCMRHARAKAGAGQKPSS